MLRLTKLTHGKTGAYGFVFGREGEPIATYSVITMASGRTLYRDRAEAVAEAKRLGLTVAKDGLCEVTK